MNLGAVDKLLDAAEEHESRNEWNKAIELYTKAIALAPKDAEIFQLRADALEEVARYEEAIVDYDRAIKLDPDNADLWFGRGFLKYAYFEPQTAESDFARAVSLNPELKQDVPNLELEDTIPVAAESLPEKKTSVVFWLAVIFGGLALLGMGSAAIHDMLYGKTVPGLVVELRRDTSGNTGSPKYEPETKYTAAVRYKTLDGLSQESRWPAGVCKQSQPNCGPRYSLQQQVRVRYTPAVRGYSSYDDADRGLRWAGFIFVPLLCFFFLLIRLYGFRGLKNAGRDLRRLLTRLNFMKNEI